jgi:hypothetical protein
MPVLCKQLVCHVDILSMKRDGNLHIFIFIILILGLTIACSLSAPVSEPKATVAPIKIGSDLTAIDICQAIPREDIEAVMGRKLVSAPQHFNYYETPGAGGCSYDAGKDASGSAYFGYVVLTPIEAYNTQPLYKNVDVKDIGLAAYFNNGADARQLWVKINDKVAFVVAFGDEPREEGARAIAKLILAAIVSP